MSTSATKTTKRMAAGLTHYQRPYGDADRKQSSSYHTRYKTYGGGGSVGSMFGFTLEQSYTRLSRFVLKW